MTTFHIITLFPEMFDSYFSSSIIGRAREKGKVKIRFYSPFDFLSAGEPRPDDRPYGGGPGMVLRALPVLRAAKKAMGRKENVPVYIFSPGGAQFSNALAEDMSKKKHIVLICGKYEGVDARVKDALGAEEISIGPFTLTGGEVPAMAVVDAVARRIPGVLGKEESLEEKREASGEVYTRPEKLTFRGKTYAVPPVLLSGDHGKIRAWRAKRKSL